MNLLEESMRASSVIFAAVAGLAVGFAGTLGANAMTSISPAGVRVATEAMDPSALVRCRCREEGSVATGAHIVEHGEQK